MPSFLGGSSSPFDEIIEKATNETNTSENWALIMDICDRISGGGSKSAKDGLLSIKKRLNHRDPHVIMLAFSVLDACMSNCGGSFQREVCTREFISELRSKATGSNHKVAEKARLLIKKWSEDECKSDASLSLIPSLYSDLRKDGYKFESSDPPKRSTQSIPADPNYVSTKEEEDAIAKAIQASLKEAGGSESVKQQTQPLYPLGSVQTAHPPSRTVKALYDFEAAEDNELTFKAGEIINILDDSDINWWKGSNQRGDGLFPASFVTADLTAPVDQPATSSESGGKRKSVQFDEVVDVKEVDRILEQEPPRIDEEKLNHCLQLLEDADPAGERPDPPELPGLEEQCQGMRPLIDAELAEIDRQHNLLAEVDVKLRDALGLYDAAMQEATAHFQAQLHSLSGSVQQQPQPGGSYDPRFQQPGMMYAAPQQQQGMVQQQPQSLPPGGVVQNSDGSYQQQIPPPMMDQQQQQQMAHQIQAYPQQMQSLPPMGMSNPPPGTQMQQPTSFVQYQ